MNSDRRHFSHFVARFEEYLSGALLTGIFLILCWQILGRLLPIYTPIWTEELARWMFVYLVLVGSAGAFLRGEHVAMDLLLKRLPGQAAQVWVAIVIHGLIALSFLAILPAAWSQFRRTRVLPAISIDVPESVLYFAAVMACVLIAIRCIQKAVADFRKLAGSRVARGRDEPDATE